MKKMNHVTLALVAAMLFAASDANAITLPLTPGLANNGGSSGWSVFFDLTASADLNVTELTTASTAPASTTFTVEIFTRSGTALGGPVDSGPGSSPAGWTSLGTATATQGAVPSGISLPIDIPDIFVGTGQTLGVAMLFTGAGPRYTGTGTPSYSVFADSNLSVTTGDVRSAPFTMDGSFFASRALNGEISYELTNISGTIPEPATATLGLAALGGLMMRRRRMG